VALIGAAAAADDRQRRQPVAKQRVARGQLLGVAGIQPLGLVELGVAQPGCVGANAGDAPGPRAIEDAPRSATGARS
jgi:hypothetical protein